MLGAEVQSVPVEAEVKDVFPAVPEQLVPAEVVPEVTAAVKDALLETVTAPAEVKDGSTAASVEVKEVPTKAFVEVKDVSTEVKGVPTRIQEVPTEAIEVATEVPEVPTEVEEVPKEFAVPSDVEEVAPAVTDTGTDVTALPAAEAVASSETVAADAAPVLPAEADSDTKKLEDKTEEATEVAEVNKEVVSEVKKEEAAVEKVEASDNKAEDTKEEGTVEDKKDETAEEKKDEETVEKPKLTKIGSTRFIWPGEPVGEQVDLDSVKAYHAAPAAKEDGSETTSVILLIHDGLGWTLKNCRLICDSLASATGCHVYMPDLFGGDTLQMTEAQMSGLLDDHINVFGRMLQALRAGIAFPKMSAFMKKHGPEKTQPLLDKAVAEIVKKHGGDKCKLGAVGYSWGAKYALRLGAQHKVAAAVACTPVSAVNPKEDNLKDNKAPTLVVRAEKSRVFSDKLWKEVESALKDSGAPLETLVCAGTTHGFANRCTESVPAACKGKDDAFLKTVSWFSQYLK